MLQMQPCWAEESQPQPLVRRPDPDTEEYSPVEPDQVIPGKIYSHYSQRHGGYVWAYAKAGGGFSYALGPGSTEDPVNFDVVTSERKTKEIIESEAGPWAKQSRRERSAILVRLGADYRWKVVRARAIRSHYDLDSGRRWEWHGKRKVAVLNMGGNQWTHDGSGYRPGPAGSLVMGLSPGPCRCIEVPHGVLY